MVAGGLSFVRCGLHDHVELGHVQACFCSPEQCSSRLFRCHVREGLQSDLLQRDEAKNAKRLVRGFWDVESPRWSFCGK